MPEIIAILVGLVCVVLLLALVLVEDDSPLRLLRLRSPWRAHLSAEARARGLMRDLLSPTEFQQIAKFGYLEVPSPHYAERIYRIPGAGGLVKVFERGCAIMELCLQSIEPLPDGDVVVLHKLMIESNEDEYLQRANRFAPGIISLRYQ